MANEITLSDGQTIYAEDISSLSALTKNDDLSTFSIWRFGSAQTVVIGNTQDVAKDYQNICRAIGVADPSDDS
ncbi:hypothetical protein [Xanthomonas prunicola]|uniref:Uncharacterized protein n=1 Tax=Xanthomonas prunicola TaxID=2053930 RepID=A0A9Q9MS43_9XANT|nr:hypothetical protein [Xanthomonas prunicola]UXA66028.1 hypothetical protein M0D43_03005 [Xanthomonas prunicola]